MQKDNEGLGERDRILSGILGKGLEAAALLSCEEAMERAKVKGVASRVVVTPHRLDGIRMTMEGWKHWGRPARIRLVGLGWSISFEEA